MRKISMLKRALTGISLAFGLMLAVSAGCVTDTSAAETSESSETEIKYTVKKVKDKVLMIPGETRLISTVIPDGSAFTSSNPKVVTVTAGGQMIAKKGGTAKVTHTIENIKYVYNVKVNEEVDLIVFAGQSNMCGSGGNAAQAPKPSYGTAYEFDITTSSKKTILMKEPFGEGTNRSNGLSMNGNYSTNGTLVSAFCINYYKQTKTPVVGISCAWGGSATNTWLNRGLVSKTQDAVKQAKKQLKKKKVKVRHIYMVWYQGESDASQGISSNTYISRMKKIYKRMKNTGVEKVFVIKIGHDTGRQYLNGSIMEAQDKLCKNNKNFIMVSKSAPGLLNYSYAFYSDTIHLNQSGLNKIGYEAGKAAGKYVKKQSR